MEKLSLSIFFQHLSLDFSVFVKDPLIIPLLVLSDPVT